MRSWTQGGSDPMTRVPIRDVQKRDTQEEGKDEEAVVWSKAKESLEPPEAERGQERIFFRDFGGDKALPTV